MEEGAWWCSSLVAIRARVLGRRPRSRVLGSRRRSRVLVLGPRPFVVRRVRFAFVSPLCSSRVLVVLWFHVVVGSLCCVVVVGL